MNNNCEYDIIHDLQKNKERVVYHLDNMFACSDIGNIRKTQEDAVLIMNHPSNNDFKIASIADGMGGLINGEVASNLALKELIKWFKNLPSNFYNSEYAISREIDNFLIYLDEYLRKTCNPSGTTLTVALKSLKNTLLLNVGDSRIYLDNGKRITQINTDHSIAWNLYEKKIIKEKDDIRFHKKNNLLTSRLGCERRLLKIEKKLIPNNEYNNIFLFSDGLTDCLSDSQIEQIIRKNHNYETLVDNAKQNLSTKDNLNNNDYYDIIEAGKDNISIAVLKKSYRR